MLSASLLRELAGVIIHRKTFSCVSLYYSNLANSKTKENYSNRSVCVWYEYTYNLYGQALRLVCMVAYLYIIQAWADWRCLFFPKAMLEPEL